MEKELKVIEWFAGYGSQLLALKNIGLKIHEDSKICEWNVDPIIANAVLHHYKEFKNSLENNYWCFEESGEEYREAVINFLLNHYTLSTETKKIDGSYVPIDYKQYKRMKVDRLWKLKAALDVVHNLGSIMDIKGEQVKNFDLFTYSFPCQDLSLGNAKGVGIKKGSRSGLLFEFIRILEEIPFKNRPKTLLMENVKGLITKKNMPDFKWLQRKLNQLGYSNAWFVVNAKNHGVPQNRERVLMISTKQTGLEKLNTIKLETLKQEVTCKLRDYLILDNSPLFDILNKKQIEKLFGINKEYMINTKNYYQGNANGHNSQVNRVYKEDKIIGTLTASTAPFVMTTNPLVIRKLTPKESYRLMGLKDHEIDRIMESIESKRANFKLAGNSVVVNVLEDIFRKFFLRED